VSKRRLVDTNLIFCYLAQDHEKQPRPLKSCSMPATVATWCLSCCQLFWPSACLCWNPSTSMPVEISHRCSADPFPTRVSKFIARQSTWIRIDRR